MSERVLTVKQPWSSLIIAGEKTVENRSKPVPSTLPQWRRCTDPECGHRQDPWCAIDWCDNDHKGEPDGPFPFRLWIHAGKGWDKDWTFDAESGRIWHPGHQASRFLTCHPGDIAGVLLGYVTVTGCHHDDDCYEEEGMVDTLVGPQYHDESRCSPYAMPGMWHWTLTNPVALPEPIAMRGQPGLFFLPDDVLAQAQQQLEVPA